MDGAVQPPDSTCCICLEGLLSKGRQTLPCGHVLHEACVFELRRRGASNTCPLCRKDTDLTPVQVLVDDAVAFWARKEYKKCASVASEVLDIEPGNDAMASLLAEILWLGLGQPQDADRAQEILEMQVHADTPGHSYSAVMLAMICSQRGRSSEAEQILTQAHRQGAIDVSVGLGALCISKGWLSEAETFLVKAHRQGFAGAAHAFAALRTQQGRLSEAEQILQQSLRDGDLQNAACALVDLYMQQDRLAEAETILGKVYRQGFGHAATLLGELRMRQGRHSEAEQILQQALRDGDLEHASCVLASLYLEQGRLAEAETLLDNRQGCAHAAALLGELRVRQAQQSEAEQNLQHAHRDGDLEHASCALPSSSLEQILQQTHRHGDVADERFVRGEALDKGRFPDTENYIALSSEHRDAAEAHVPHSTQMSRPPVGSKVEIFGLTTPEGRRRLNGSSGVVVRHCPTTGRVGVQVANAAALKEIELGNIRLLRDGLPSLLEDAVHGPDPDQLAIQKAIEDSLTMASDVPVHLQDECTINAQISNALLRSSAPLDIQHVLLITFSRKTHAFRTALLADDKLSGCRQALGERGLVCELESGAKVFVWPEQHGPLMQAIRMSRCRFASWHLFVDPSFEEAVEAIVNNVNSALPKHQKFYKKCVKTVPLNFVASLSEMDCEATVYRTFIEISVPRLAAEGSVRQTAASTTDAAEGRKGPNVRVSGVGSGGAAAR